MEDDDEFGDLYTDVLRPFTTSFPSHQPTPTTISSLNRPIDLNTIQSDDEDLLFVPPNSNSNPPKTPSINPPKPDPIINKPPHFDLNLNEDVKQQEGLPLIGISFPESDAKLRERAFGDSNFTEADNIDVVVEEREDTDDVLIEKDESLVGKIENTENFGVGNEIGEMGSNPILPGLSIPGVSGFSNDLPGDGNVEDDWDSDSEDDLQIVLNDNNHGPMGMERIGGGDDEDDEDEDGEPLVIVVDTDNPNHQRMVEEQDWGEEAGQAGDGERKELGCDMVKVNGGVAVAPKIGYSNIHGNHPFHSQFKYVRPGAVPMPGAAPVGPGAGGTPGHFRPPVNMGPVAGRGRGDWQLTGMKNAPMQKGLHSGHGMPLWGNNARGFGSGMDFTLPSHKTIFEVDIGSFEGKPWTLTGIDVSDFFNFGLDEQSWKEYCKRLEQFRLETTMQSKIRVYESGRTELDFDPDLPPELAAAAGIHDVSSHNANNNILKKDAGQSEFAKESAYVRQPLPTGRAIQVESGYGERLPSIDTRPPRIRDSDAIIEIVLQDSTDVDSCPGNYIVDNDQSRENFRGGDEIEDNIVHEDAEPFDDSPCGYDGRKREHVERRTPLMNPVNDIINEGDGMMHSPSEAPIKYRSNSRGHTPVSPNRSFGVPNDERRTKGRERGTSPGVTPSGSTMEKQIFYNQKEDSAETSDGKNSPPLSSPANAGGLNVERKDAVDDEIVLVDGSHGMESEAMDVNTITAHDTLKDENLMHSLKAKKLSSQVKHPSLRDKDDDDDRDESKAARSSENSKARSGSSKDYRKSHHTVEEEVVQGGRATRIGIIKRAAGENEVSGRRKDWNERPEIKTNRMTVKEMEDSYSRNTWEPNLAHHSHVKTESIGRRRESDNSDVAWQRRDEDLHGRRTRAEDIRKWEHSEEIGSRHRSKVRENEKSDRDDHHQLRKYLNNGSWRAHHDKDMESRHKDGDNNLKSRNEKVDELHSKTRKESHSRRHHTEKEFLPVHRENSSHRKREKDDILDSRKRDDQARLRDDDQLYVRHKEEGLFQRERGERLRERDEWHVVKQSHEESLLKRERDDGRGGLRSGRAAENKAWAGNSRVKDEYKGSDREYLKNAGPQSEQLKRKDRVENDSFSQHRRREDVYTLGNQLSNDEKRARHERASSRNDGVVNASDSHKMHEKKQQENTRKSKESESGDHYSLTPLKRKQEDHNGKKSDTVSSKGTVEQGSAEHEIPLNHPSSTKYREVSSDEEQQDSRRGRSKMERWKSHKERDSSISTKSSFPLKVKKIDRYDNNESSLASKLPEESSKKVEGVDNQHPLDNENDGSDPENKNADVKPTKGRHLDTVAKLKKRSERFKLPMPSEKEAMTTKKMENEALPSAQSETHADSEFKPERPARKRRWTGN